MDTYRAILTIRTRFGQQAFLLPETTATDIGLAARIAVDDFREQLADEEVTYLQLVVSCKPDVKKGDAS